MPGKYSSPVYTLDIPWPLYDLAILLALAILFPIHDWSHQHADAFALIVRLISGIGILTLIYGSFIEPWLLKIRRYAVGKGERSLRVAFLSDIHVGPYKGAGWVRKLVEKTNALQPDVILLGGDFLYKKADALPELEPLRGMKASLGTYAILGNHDEWVSSPEAHAWFAASGIPLLENKSVRVQKDGVPIRIAGADDDWYGETDLAKAFAEIAPDETAIIMLHNPDLAPPAAALLKGRPGKTFFFSGHTHGGQIRLPFIGPLMHLPHHIGRKYDRGLFDFQGIPYVIGAGSGESGPRARLFCRPEIVLAELRY